MSRQTLGSGDCGYPSGSTCPSEASREGPVQSIAFEDFAVDFDMAEVDCSRMEVDAAVLRESSKEHLEKMKMRCHSILQQVNRELSSHASPEPRKNDTSSKPRTSFGGA
jgi:hypothetical protein